MLREYSVIPVGYILRRVATTEPSMKLGPVVDIYSVSSCISKDFAEYIRYWRHNGYWLFNRPGDMDEILAKEDLNRDLFKLLYYELYEQQFDENAKQWSAVTPPEASFVTLVERPVNATLEGFDVATWSMGSIAGCSPLSCNYLARELPVNSHCLFESFEAAMDALEAGKFANTEPGPFRIWSAYSVSTRRAL